MVWSYSYMQIKPGWLVPSEDGRMNRVHILCSHKELLHVAVVHVDVNLGMAGDIGVVICPHRIDTLFQCIYCV